MAGGLPIKIAVAGADTAAAARELAASGVAEVLHADHPSLAPYTPDGFTVVLQQIVEQAAPAFVLLPHTYQTRDFAPMLAGKLAADVRPRGEGPFFVTLQIGAFRADAVPRGGTAPVTSVQVTVDA